MSSLLISIPYNKLTLLLVPPNHVRFPCVKSADPEPKPDMKIYFHPRQTSDILSKTPRKTLDCPFVTFYFPGSTEIVAFKLNNSMGYSAEPFTDSEVAVLWNIYRNSVPKTRTNTYELDL